MLGQFIGAFLGAILFWLVTGKTAIPVPNTPDGVTEIIKFCINEIVGSFLFGICVLVVTNQRTTYATKSWQTYLSVVVSLFLARK
jgi:glycerol uptake facilitator-like aquaporin